MEPARSEVDVSCRGSQCAGRAALAWAALATIVLGAFVELAEGATQTGHCRLRDLVPDIAAAMLGTVVVLASQRGIGLISSHGGDGIARANPPLQPTAKKHGGSAAMR
jgi:hypothetical protein